MNKCLILIILFLLIFLIYSEYQEGQTNVRGDGTTKKCGIPIKDCQAYDTSSTSESPKYSTCSGDKVISTDKTAWVEDIDDYDDISADGKCTICREGKISSSDKKVCVNEINGYVSYKADGTCINMILDFSWLKIKINVFMDIKLKKRCLCRKKFCM